ncbi:L,D-transpeptidase [Thalassorhabdomicrobium marinisediminis]|uniref:L,D-transpeptidase n=1 Tax=Thalassorhabdomicrobium marinisediminis TaxID=2170577 RepID=A0A2T7G1V0_9RHOB|nr:L,D-transpeptidase [Thalassorhabdomicrobium marinisediminis]PVA08384.1 L,D-transpeptidase [Thalassorhabdomicrobium marinisediminis]
MEISMQTKRTFLLGAAATLAAPALVRAQTGPAPERNASSFVVQDWRDHFETLGNGAILADITSRALHFWKPDGSYRLFPSSVPLSEELTRRGYSRIVRKKVAPSWTPTASMRERDPSLPLRMEGGPGNPLGTHALYLDWPAYLIHGTHDTRKIGRQSSSGCIGLYNEHIESLYGQVEIGTQVRLL